jgi:excisionase family DNA binding protein
MKRKPPKTAFLSVQETADVLKVSESTVWRWLRHGELGSVQHSGRRLVSSRDVARRSRALSSKLRPLTKDHPMWKLIGAFKSGGAGPGSGDKHALLAR